jgi:hypothetical protein
VWGYLYVPWHAAIAGASVGVSPRTVTCCDCRSERVGISTYRGEPPLQERACGYLHVPWRVNSRSEPNYLLTVVAGLTIHTLYYTVETMESVGSMAGGSTKGAGTSAFPTWRIAVDNSTIERTKKRLSSSRVLVYSSTVDGSIIVDCCTRQDYDCCFSGQFVGAKCTVPRDSQEEFPWTANSMDFHSSKTLSADTMLSTCSTPDSVNIEPDWVSSRMRVGVPCLRSVRDIPNDSRSLPAHVPKNRLILERSFSASHGTAENCLGL